MDSAVRSYIVRILLLHAAFLVAAAVVIASAGLALYSTARADAETAALERAAVPANQAKDLLERHFQAIFDTLRLADVRLAPEDPTPASYLATDAAGRDLWTQLRGHVSGLLEVDPTGMRLIDFRSDPPTAGRAPDHAAGPLARQFRPIGSSVNTRELAQALVDQAQDFLKQVIRRQHQSVSGVFWLHEVGPAGEVSRTPVILAALPMLSSPAPGPATQPATTQPQPRAILLGVVPVSYLEQSFLFPASQAERSVTLLFDSEGRLVAGAGEPYAGKLVEELVPRQLPPPLATYVRNTVSGGSSDVRRQFSGRVDIGGNQFSSALVTARAVRVGDRPLDETSEPDSGEAATARMESQGPLPAGALEPVTTGKQPPGQAPMWLFVFINRGAVIAPLAQTARTAILWAAVMVLAISVVLVSSAIQLIRGRSRLESLRTEMIDRELREARQIQLMWLPRDTTHQPGDQVEIAAENIPASHISGDFYNYFDLPDGRTALVIGDVTGHGLVAAFLMATTQLLVRTTLQRLSDPGMALEDVNNQLCSQSYHGQFVTLQLIIIDEAAKQILAASAGHPPPLACGQDGTWRALPLEPQLVLGVLAESRYPTAAISLEDSQALLLYTDGVIEVKNSREKRFNLDQLLEQLNLRAAARASEADGEGRSACPSSARELVEETFFIVREFAGDTPQDDDLTLVAVHLLSRRAPRPNSSDKSGRADAGTSSRAAAPTAGTRRSR